MTRAVLDANVFVSAILAPRGTPASLLEALREMRFRLVASLPILREVGRALTYPKVARRHGLSAPSVRIFLSTISGAAFLTPGGLRLRIVESDPDDDRYLECAVEGLADFLVTGDRHLLRIAEFETVSIVTPRAFLTHLDREAPRGSSHP
ncbi:MAG: putative toxin-antitoxin system toxin component, PIN family [Planctomycetota bacterium]